jgi:hypothetical protein
VRHVPGTASVSAVIKLMQLFVGTYAASKSNKTKQKNRLDVHFPYPFAPLRGVAL